MYIGRLALKARKFVEDNSPVILTGVGVVGTLATAYLTHKGTFKAVEILLKEDMRRVKESDEKIDSEETSTFVKRLEARKEIPVLTRKEMFLLTWKCYTPAAGVAAVTVTSIVFANRITTRRAAALATAYTLSERAYSEYKDKVKEKLGLEEEQKVRDEVAKDRVLSKQPPEAMLIDPLTGYQLIHEGFTDRYFWSTKAAVMNAVNDIYKDINHSEYATLSEFYGKIGLPNTDVADELGWNSEHPIEIGWTPVELPDGRTANSFGYTNLPIFRPDRALGRRDVEFL